MRMVIVIDESSESLRTVKGALSYIHAAGMDGPESKVDVLFVVSKKDGRSYGTAEDDVRSEVSGEAVDMMLRADGSQGGPHIGSEVIRSAMASIADAGLEGDLLVLFGKPAKRIVRYANEKNADLLVIGSYYRRRFRKGSGSGRIGRQVSQRTHCPVLFIMDPDTRVGATNGRAASRGLLGGAMDHVAVAIDGSSESLEAVRSAIRLAEHRKGMTVNLITVIPVMLYADIDYDPLAEYGEMQRRIVMTASIMLDEAGIANELTMLHGRPADEIARYVDAADMDLLIVGSRALTAMYAIAVGGSVSARLTSQMHCPLLIVKNPEALLRSS